MKQDLLKLLFRIIPVFLILPVLASGQSLREKVNQGNENYRADEYEQAINKYKDALLDDPLNDKILFNQSDALYKMKKYDDAVEGFQKVLGSKDLSLASRAYFNIGNSYFQQDKLTESIESYKKALDLNPDDLDAKYNLELARAKLKEQSKKQQQSPQQNQQNKQQQQDQQQQQDNKDQQQKNPEDQQNQQDQQQQQQQEKDKEKDQQQSEEQQAQKKEDKINKEEAERILNALRADEQDAQKNKAPVKASGRVSGKDW